MNICDCEGGSVIGRDEFCAVCRLPFQRLIYEPIKCATYACDGLVNRSGEVCKKCLKEMKRAHAAHAAHLHDIGDTTKATHNLASEEQVGGDHYRKLAIQPSVYVHRNKIPYLEGSVIYYVTRWRDKGGIKDIDKAIHTLQLLKELEQNNGNESV